MSRRRQLRRGHGEAVTPKGGLLALSPIEELDEEQSRVLFRRRALYVIGGAILFAIVYSLLSWLKYRAYMDARYDLGNMVQAVYNTAHGHFLEITTGDLEPRQVSRLGSHVDPILALFALPWLVWPSPVMLLVGQAVIVATGAWPAYRLGTRVTRDPSAGAFLAGAYLLYPALGFLVLNEFHPVALAAPLLLWAFLYMDEDRWVRAAVFLVLAAACKETVPLVIAFMGAYFAIRKRSPWPLLVTGVGLAWFAAAVWVVIPHYNGAQSAFIARYGDYGDGALSVVKHAITHPGQTVADLFAESNLRYWLRLLWPFGFTSLLSPLTVLIALPEYGLNALSATSFQRRIEFHYTALEIPFLYAAAVLGVMRLWRWLGGGFRKAESLMQGQRVQRSTLALFVVLCALAGNYVLGPLPFSLPGGGLRRSGLRQDGARCGARRGRRDDPPGRQGVGQQQRRRPAGGAPRGVHLPVLRRCRLGDRRPAASVLLRQGGRADAFARPGPAGARPQLPFCLRQGRGVRVPAYRCRRAGARRPDPCAGSDSVAEPAAGSVRELVPESLTAGPKTAAAPPGLKPPS